MAGKDMEYTKVNAVSVTHISDGYGQFHTELYVNQAYAAIAYIFAYRANIDDDEVIFVPTGIKTDDEGSSEAILASNSEEAERLLKETDYVGNYDAVIVDKFSRAEKCRFRVSVKNTIA